MKRILFISIILTLLSTFGLYATLVLDPSGAGGFELGSSFADNGWTAVNSASTEWTFGTAQFTAGTNGAYITEGGSYTYSAVSQKVHLYHSVTIPEGETMTTVSFKWKNTGEGASSDWDNLKVFLAPSTYTIPAAGSEISSTYRIGANWYNQQADWQQASILLNPLTAGTYNLIFTWKTDGGTSNPPPAAIDQVSIVTSAPPSPLTGIKTIGTGGDYTTFTGAINDLNVAGVGAGGVTFNVSAGAVFTEEIPVITATGTSANPIIFQKSGAGANPEIQPTTGTQGIRIVGGDYITFDGIDIRVATGQIPNWGYYITNASATNGALYNTIKNAKITLNKANTSTKGIYDYYNVTPTNQTGINSYNTYQNLTIENSTQGIYVYGHSSYYSIGNVITNCTIGANTADDMGGGSTGYGIYAYYQDGLQISNNVIRNFTCSSSSVYGVYLYTAKNTSNLSSNTIYNLKTNGTYSNTYGVYGSSVAGTMNVYKNRVYNLETTLTSSTYAQYGMYMTLGTSGSNVANVYNNMVWDIKSAYTGSGSTSYLATGIYLGGATSTNTYNVDYNSVRVIGPATSNSAGIYFAANTAINKLRNNVIVNNTPNQTGSYYHTCVYFNHASTIGAATSVANNNVLYLANANNGLVVRGLAANYPNIQAWTAASTQDANSRPTDPQIDAANPLNILTTVPTPVESKAMFLAGITTDIYGTTRNTSTPDIGAHEGNFVLEAFCEAPTAQPTNLVLIPNSTTIAGSFTAAAANAYLVVGHASSTLTFSPVDGTYYSAGQIFNTTEVIISASPSTSFTATALTPATQYYCTIFAFNNTGIGAPKYYLVGPLTGTQTTLPAAPAVPGTLTATVISPSQIDLVFTANPAGDNIMIARNTVNTFGTPLATGYAINDPITGGGTVIYMGPAGTFNDNALAGGTLYYYSAWSYITAERTLYYAFSTTTKTANATTPQVPAILPFAETFEVWPNNWSVVNGSQTNQWHVGIATAYAGTKSAYISNDNGINNTYTNSTANFTHLYRDVTFTAGASDYELSFMWKAQGEGTQYDYDNLKVFVLDTTVLPVAGTAVATASQVGANWYNFSPVVETVVQWANGKISLPGTLAGTTKRVVFSWKTDSSGGTQPPVAVDNVTLTAFMTPKPTALTASAITANSALLSWTSAAISFDLEWGTLGFSQGSGTMLSSITNNYTLGSLSAQTGYSYYVRANDGVNPSAWAGPYSFYTVFPLPYTTGFDATTNPAAGWWNVINSTSTSAVINVSTTSPNSVPNNIYMYNPGSNQGALVSFVSPAFSAPLSTLYTRFYARGTAGRNLFVGVVNSLSPSATFTPVATIPLTSSNAPYVVDFTTYAGSDQYVSFRLDTTDTVSQYVYIDDVTVSTAPWDELALTSFTVTPLYKFTAAEVTFSMTVKNNGTNSAGKNVVLKQGATELATVPVGNLAVGETANLTYVWTPTTAGTFSLTAELPVDVDITNNNASLTNQTVYISGQLAEGFEGLTWPPNRWQQWQGTAENAWAQTSASNYDGSKAAGVILTTTNSSSYLATPKLSFTASNNTVSFYARSTGTNQKIQVWYGDSTDGTSYNTIGEPIAITGTYTQYTITAPTLAGSNHRVAFQADPSGNAGTIYIDNVVGPMIYIPAEAPGPVALVLPANNAPAFDPETGILSWTPPSSGGDAVGYYVRLSQNPDAFDEEDNASFDGTVHEVVATTEPTQTFLVYSEQLLSYNNDWHWQVIPFNDEYLTPLARDCEHRIFHTIDQITAPGTLALGSIFPNASRTGSIIVTNAGPTPVSFTVTGSPEFVFDAPPYSVPANDTYELGYTFTATATPGAYTGSVQINETDGGLVQIPISVTANVSNEVSLGTGTSNLYMPIYSFYDYSTSQVIYPADWIDVPAGQRIEKLNYYYNHTAAPANTQDFKIWMGYTDQVVFPSTINSSTWLPIAPMTLVFDGIWNISAGAGWKEIILHNPFPYDPANGNLVVVVDENTLGDSGTSSAYFRSTATTGIYRGISCYDDNDNMDPADPAAIAQSSFSSYAARAGYPNTKFVFGEIPTQPVTGINPESWDAGVTYLGDARTQEFSIRNNGVGTLTVSTISTPAGSPFSVINPPALPANLTNTDAPITFTVEYQPTAVSASDQAVITIDTNEAADPTVTVTGSCLDPTIYAINLPVLEDFDDVTDPILPEGWTKQVASTSTSYGMKIYPDGTPHSEPNEIRMYSYYPADEIVLISPLIDPLLTTIRIKFWAKCSSSYTSEVIVGTMSGPGTRAVFVPFETINLSSTYTRYSVNFALYGGIDKRIAFKLQTGSSNEYNYVYLDDVTFEHPQDEPPVAATPTFPPNAIVTLKNPLLKWTLSDAGEPVEYSKVFMNTSGVFDLDADTDVVYNGSATQYQSATPLPGTEYFWQVVNYNVHGRTAGPVWSFTTPGQYDLAEGFEGSFPPAGWSREDYWYSSTAYAWEGTKSVYRSTSTSPVRMITPVLDYVTDSMVRFNTYVVSSTYTRMQLSYLDGATWTNVGPELVLIPGAWQSHEVDLTILADNSYKLGFGAYYVTGGSSAYVYLDHVIGPEITAILPDAVTQNTPVVDAVDQFNLPTFSWTAAATGGIPESYKIYVGLSNTFTEADLKATVTSSPYRLTSPLAYATPYYWQVVAHNRAGDSINNGVRSFTTMANPTINVLPMEVDFTTFPPAAWYRGTGLLANPNSPTYSETYWVQGDWLNITSPVNEAAKMNIYGANRSGWLITPPINIPSSGHRLELDIGLTDFASTAQADSPTDDRFIILIGDGSTWAPANILREWNNTGSPYVYDTIPNTGTHVTIPLDSYTGVYQIAFYGESIASGGDNDFFVDNVKVWLPPANDLAATTVTGPGYGYVDTPLTHTIRVSNYGSVTQSSYDVNLKRYGDDVLLGTVHVTEPLISGTFANHAITWTPSSLWTGNLYGEVVLTGDSDLTNNVTSNFAFGVYPEGALVEGFESGAIPNDWTIINSDGDTYQWDVQATNPHTGTYHARCHWNSSVNNDWLITPPLQVTSAVTGDQISFWIGKFSNTYPEDWQVLISTTDTNIASFTMIDSGDIPAIGYIQKTYNLDSYGDAVIYLAIRYVGTNDFYIYVDDFVGPTKYVPQAPVVTTEVLGTSVKLTWPAVSHARSYHILAADDPYGTFSLLTTVTGTEYTITAPEAKKFYKVLASTDRFPGRSVQNSPLSREAQIQIDEADAIRNNKNQ